jgi:Zn-dependent protease
MKGSFHIATVGGIPVKIHWTFGLLLLWVAYSTSAGGFNPYMVVISIGIVLSVFFCVILHEFGHAMAARRYGVKTFDILMTPIGGIARLERMPQGKGQEFWVALAGPVVNFVIVGLIWIGFLLFEGVSLPLFTDAFWNFDTRQPSYFMILLMANGYLGLFNLLPAFPMDGGRMLRSLLSLRLSRERATQIASYTGQGLAIIMFVIGVMRGQPTLTLIGVFIFFAARQENRSLQMQKIVTKSVASDLMEPVEHRLHLGLTIDAALEQVKSLARKSFIVWSKPGVPAGYITKDRLMENQDGNGANVTIDSLLTMAPVAIPAETPILQLIPFMQQNQLPIVLVTNQHGFVGVIAWDQLEKILN